MTSITCPQGLGDTDRTRCIDRAACLLPPMACACCPIPMILIAEGRDNFNRRIAGRLRKYISSPWKGPAIPRRRKPTPIREPKPTPGLFMAIAIRTALALDTARPQPKASLSRLLTVYNQTPGVTPLANQAALYRALRRFGLPVRRASSSLYSKAYNIEPNDHIRAFVRGYCKAAA
jgi:hypothetical protein